MGDRNRSEGEVRIICLFVYLLAQRARILLRCPLGLEDSYPALPDTWCVCVRWRMLHRVLGSRS